MIEDKFLYIIAIYFTILCSLLLILGVGYAIVNNKNNKDEYIQQLEQSLEEQIQEKEVYMEMLEECNERLDRK